MGKLQNSKGKRELLNYEPADEAYHTQYFTRQAETLNIGSELDETQSGRSKIWNEELAANSKHAHSLNLAHHWSVGRHGTPKCSDFSQENLGWRNSQN